MIEHLILGRPPAAGPTAIAIATATTKSKDRRAEKRTARRATAHSGVGGGVDGQMVAQTPVLPAFDMVELTAALPTLVASQPAEAEGQDEGTTMGGLIVELAFRPKA